MASMTRPALAAVFVVLLAPAGAALAAGAPLLAEGPNPDAPDAVRQYGQLMGDWTCASSSLQADGTWLEAPGRATWSWYYVLEGYAVQDVWRPGDPAQPVGTNLRTYDAEADTWHMVWATSAQARFDHFSAVHQDGRIVMTGERWARKAFPAHTARITFYGITDKHFDWSYEFSASGEAPWTEQSRLSCDRIS